MKTLRFVGPTLLPTQGGRGVTVRVGTKWADVPTTETLDIWVCDNPHRDACAPLSGHCYRYGYGKIRATWSGDLLAIPQELVAIEHEPRCRNWQGLLYELWDIYGDDIGMNPFVVAIEFEIETLATQGE